MTTFICEWKIRPECIDDCLTLFGAMNTEMDKKDAGPDCEQLGRWSNLGNGTGCLVAKCKDAEAFMNWLVNWAPMCTITSYIALDDNETREIVLGKKPDWQASYANINDECQPGESLYFIKYKFQQGKAQEGYKLLANMTEEQDKADPGNCRPLCRYHDIAQGQGIAICAAKNQVDPYKWAYNWSSMCDVSITPVVTDAEARKMMQAKPGFQEKVGKVMKKLGMDQQAQTA